ncbi:DUF1127 domain-containing protein [Bradyrhizobium sp. ORS 111]|uniref:DUF1127 domain-containing protein n=1 Tax=Bradyrhizobium sp. ORS 111 TaxID=1685958 RepID=UPI00388DEA94
MVPRGAAARPPFGTIGRWLFSLVSEWIAAFITQRKYQASLAFLQSLSDEELRDIGLHRGLIGSALQDAASYRVSRQRPNPYCAKRKSDESSGSSERHIRTYGE